jgi:hypothetical protein
MMSALKFEVLLSRSSFTEEQKELLRDAYEGGLTMILVDGGYMDMYAYIELHQLEPMTQMDPQNQRDINTRLDKVMLDERR